MEKTIKLEQVMAIVGVLARIEMTLGDEVRRDLSSLPGVTPFDLDVVSGPVAAISASPPRMKATGF